MPKPCSTWPRPTSAGLGVAKDLAQADAAYRKGIEASCVYNGVAAATAASFAAGVPSLSTLGGDDKGAPKRSLRSSASR